MTKQELELLGMIKHKTQLGINVIISFNSKNGTYYIKEVTQPQKIEKDVE